MFEKYKILGEDYVLVSLNENNAILLCTNDIKIKDNLNFANEVFKNNLKDYMDIISGALNK